MDRNENFRQAVRRAIGQADRIKGFTTRFVIRLSLLSTTHTSQRPTRRDGLVPRSCSSSLSARHTGWNTPEVNMDNTEIQSEDQENDDLNDNGLDNDVSAIHPGDLPLTSCSHSSSTTTCPKGLLQTLKDFNGYSLNLHISSISTNLIFVHPTAGSFHTAGSYLPRSPGNPIICVHAATARGVVAHHLFV